jgi:hypothetical protein
VNENKPTDVIRKSEIVRITENNPTKELLSWSTYKESCDVEVMEYKPAVVLMAYM